MAEIKKFADLEVLSRAAADMFVSLASDAIAERGRFTVSLSGGSTPKTLHRLLASDAYSPKIDWSRTHIFWGDERTVPPDDPDSNYRMARETLLDQVPVPPENVHRIKTEMQPQQAAEDYEVALRDFFQGADWPRFDLLLLGMGGDGHTASLFPHTKALDARDHWVVANHVPQHNTWRITLTVPALNASANIMFLIAGLDKMSRVYEVLRGDYNPHELPSQYIKPADGHLFWMLDEAAAGAL